MRMPNVHPHGYSIEHMDRWIIRPEDAEVPDYHAVFYVAFAHAPPSMYIVEPASSVESVLLTDILSHPWTVARRDVPGQVAVHACDSVWCMTPAHIPSPSPSISTKQSGCDAHCTTMCSTGGSWTPSPGDWSPGGIARRTSRTASNTPGLR